MALKPKSSQRVWVLFEIRACPWHQVFEEILCLRGTPLASQCRKIKRKSRYHGTRFALRIKIIHFCGLFAKHVQKFYCPTQRHHWRPRVSCLWGDRDDHTETTNRPSRPDRLEIFWNDWGDRNDPDDHMETRLYSVPSVCTTSPYHIRPCFSRTETKFLHRGPIHKMISLCNRLKLKMGDIYCILVYG